MSNKKSRIEYLESQLEILNQSHQETIKLQTKILDLMDTLIDKLVPPSPTNLTSQRGTKED